MSASRGAQATDLVVTGANGHLGRSLCLAAGGRRLRAVVRSERAAEQLRSLPPAARPEIRVLDPHDEDALAAAAAGCDAWLHLVGILKETRRASYREAHEASCERVARAAEKAGVRRIVYPSRRGAAPASANACLASKGRAEEILRAGRVPATVLRVPMVLGPGELAGDALRAEATAPFAFLLDGGRSLEQPIDADDLRRAVLAAADDLAGGDRALDLAGPESLPRRHLVVRVAAVLGRRPPRMLSVPYPALRGLARLLERLLAEPPVTEAMLGVLRHDDCIDPAPACAILGLELTPLQRTLQRTFAPPPETT